MRQITGIVTSVSMDKTIVVSLDTKVRHPKYHKEYKNTKKFYAHDEDNTCQLWDTVTIEESRPLSKLKRWVVKNPTAAKKTSDTPTKATTKKPAAKKTTTTKTATTKRTPATKK